MIKEPKFEEDDIAQISLIKKYRGKNSNDEKQTKYSFCKVGLSKDISKELRGWIKDNFNSLKGKKLSEYNPSVELEEPELINLNEIEAWSNFDDKAFSGINFSEVDLKRESSNFVGVMMYVKKGKEIWGQIKKVSKGNVLHKKGRYILYFDKNKFNDLIEEKGIRFDRNFDVLFHFDEKESKGVIFDKSNFKALFDLWEEDKKKSIENVKKVELFQESKYSDLIHDITDNDRVVQRMLRNPAFESYLNDLTYADLKDLKKDVPELTFDLNPKNKDFILPEGNEKEAMKDLIKVICGRYNYSLNGKRVIENSGVRKVMNKSNSK